MSKQLGFACLLALILTGGIVLLWQVLERSPPGPQVGRSGVESPTPREEAARETEPRDSRRRALQGPAAPVPPKRAVSGNNRVLPGEHFLGGRAFDTNRNTPLALAEFHVRLRAGTRTESRLVKTDAGGNFRLGGLRPGGYLVTFEHWSFLPVEAEVSILSGEPAADLEVIFERGLTVRGTVRNLTGGSTCDAVLEWRWGEDPEFSREVSTRENGSYEVGGLLPGRYTVRIAPGTLRRSWLKGTTREVTLEEGRRGELDFDVDLGVPLPVRVADGNGRPVPGIQVRFLLTTGGRGFSGFLPATGGDGRTLFCGLPASGRLRLEALAGERGAASTEFDLAKRPQEASLLLRASKLVQGQAVDAAGHPVERARVSAAEPGGGVRQVQRTDAQGRFQFHELSPGRWQLRATAALEAVASLVEIEVPPTGPSEPFRLVLTATCALVGRVVDATDTPVPGARVTIQGPDVREETLCGKNGTFIFAAREGETYELTAVADAREGVASTRAATPGQSVKLVLRGP